MKRLRRPPPDRTDWGSLAIAAVEAGELVTATRHLTRAIAADGRNAAHWFNLGQVRLQRGQIEGAAAAFSTALRHDPGADRAARQLSALLQRYHLSDPSILDPFGLKAALGHAAADSQALSAAAFARFKSTDTITSAIAEGRGGDWSQAARRLIVRNTAPALRDDLFLAALQAGINTDPDIEHLLTALRRAVLLEAGPERFEDRALCAFACALAAQQMLTGHVLPETAEEQQAAAALKADAQAVLAGDGEACRQLLVATLYRPVEALLSPVDPAACTGIRPRVLRDLVTGRMQQLAKERAAAKEVACLTPISDSTSQRVARQYEHSPYPRWRTLLAPERGAARRTLGRFFTAERLAFMDAPFEVLIAGAGTGQHALASAIAYGDAAHVLAIDLSRASLAYAAERATAYGVGNVEFAQGDILDLGALDRRFHVIEAVGVLHHMTDPFEGWRRLIAVLRPGGLMLIGLYSALSRRDIADLRHDPDYPEPGCSDAAARAYRALLLARSGGEAGPQLLRSEDFYTLESFRDLVLHESEVHFTLPEIEHFLDDNGLVFRGFAGQPGRWQRFAERFADDPFPGTLAHWWTLEQDDPRLFDGMYNFWCEMEA